MSIKADAFLNPVLVRCRRHHSGPVRVLFLLLACGFATSPTRADVKLLSLDGGLSGSASAGPLTGTPALCQALPDTFRRFSAASLSDSNTNNCSANAAEGQASTFKEAAYTVTVAAGLLTGFTASAAGDASSSLFSGKEGTADAQGAGEIIINVQVERATVATVAFSLSASGNGATAQIVVSSPLNCSGNGCDFLSQACSNTATSSSRCFPSTSNEVRELPDTIRLEPGMYRFTTGARTGVFTNISRTDAQNGSAAASLTVTFAPAEAPSCDLSWAAPTPGNYAEAANWAPPSAPDACANLTLNQAGAYSVAVNPGVTANSLSALGGEPSLLGGSLSLAGGNVADALRVDGAARLSLGAGTLSANGAVVGLTPVGGGAPPSFLRIEPGTSLDVVAGLDLGREAQSFGELSLGGAAGRSALTAAGGVNIGVFGRGRLLGLGALDLDVLDGMTLGVFTGSDALVELTGVFDDIRSVNMTVGETLTIGDGGNGVLSLSTLAILETDRIALGASAGGDGTLTTSGGNCSVNASTAIDVGVSGKGQVIILDASAVRAPDVVIGKGSTGVGDVTVEGQDSRLAVTGGLTVGGLGRSSLSASAGGIVEAGTLAVGDGPGVSGLLNLDGSSAEASLAVSTDMDLGVFGEAGLTGLGSTKIDVGRNLTLGAFAGASAVALIVAGEGDEAIKANKLTVADTLTIGSAGTGSLAISGSSVVKAGTMRLGVDGGGDGGYTVSGGLNFTDIFGQLTVAGTGGGEVAAGDFASIRAGACVLGDAPGGLGVLRLESGASLRVAAIPPATPVGGKAEGKDVAPVSFGFLEIGKHGNGLIELFDAGTGITCENAVLGGDNPAAGGTLSVDTGAQLTASGSLAMGTTEGPALVRVARGGTLSVAAFLLLGPKGLFVVGPEAQLNFSDITLSGRVRIVDNLVIERPPTPGKENVPPQAPKAASGPVVFNGNLGMGPDGVLEVAALGARALQITGASTLAGTLEIVLQPGVAYTDGQLVDLIQFAGGVAGTFATTTVTNAPPDFVGAVEIVDGVARLRVVKGGIGLGGGEGEGEPPIPPTAEEARALLADGLYAADSNGDGSISFAEASAAVAGLTQSVFDTLDINRDGELDKAELGIDNGTGGCNCNKSSFTLDGMKKRLGDLFLAGLAVGLLALWSARKQ